MKMAHFQTKLVQCRALVTPKVDQGLEDLMALAVTMTQRYLSPLRRALKETISQCEVAPSLTLLVIASAKTLLVPTMAREVIGLAACPKTKPKIESFYISVAIFSKLLIHSS